MDLTHLTDEILKAWQEKDGARLDALRALVPEDYDACIVNPDSSSPCVMLKRKDAELPPLRFLFSEGGIREF